MKKVRFILLLAAVSVLMPSCFLFSGGSGPGCDAYVETPQENTNNDVSEASESAR